MTHAGLPAAATGRAAGEFSYEAFGLRFASEIEVPELSPGDGASPSHVSVGYGSVPESLPGAYRFGARFQARPGELLFRIPGVAAYWVREGKRIVIDREPSAPEDDVRVFLLSSALAALIHQRGLLPVHASAVDGNGEAILFTGTSGQGKSTIAAQLSRARGLSLMCDDMSVLSLDGKGGPVLHPAFPQLKLWRDALDHLGDNPRDYPALRRNLEKHSVMTPERFGTRPLPVKHIVDLGFNNTGAVTLTPLGGAGKIDLLINRTYRKRYLLGLGGRKNHFRVCAAAASGITATALSRPWGWHAVEEALDLLTRRCLQ